MGFDCLHTPDGLLCFLSTRVWLRARGDPLRELPLTYVRIMGVGYGLRLPIRHWRRLRTDVLLFGWEWVTLAICSLVWVVLPAAGLG